MINNFGEAAWSWVLGSMEFGIWQHWQPFNLVNGNLQPKCEGFTTWSSGDQNSCIDFAVMSPGLYDRLTRMVIDEAGDHSVGSDHNRMFMEFGGRMKNERGGNEGKRFLTERDIDQIAERLEVTPEVEYERVYDRS